jgi:uncharacterized protein (TIGR00297 family)
MKEFGISGLGDSGNDQEHGLSIEVSVFAATAVSLAAFLARALSPSGAFAATLVGTVVLCGTGWAGGLALGSFFLGSTLISRGLSDPSVEQFDAKGTRRDAGQVLANGGPAAIGALLGSAGMVVASLAAAAADTWATSLGATSSRLPRLITTGRPVAPGTSGALSWPGTFGALLGAATVGGVAALAFGSPRLFPLSLGLGLGGMLLDSLLGAGIQARFSCPTCQVQCERPVHRCGTRAVHVYGWRWCTNDAVNVLATTVAGIAGALLTR